MRPHADGMCSFLGLVELPAGMPAEHQLPVKFNSSGVWLLEFEARQPSGQYYGWHESGITNLLTSFEWRRPAVPDASDAFLRESVLPHQDPQRRWMILTGVSTQTIPLLPQEGLYELRAGSAPVLVDNNAYNGYALGSILREPLWGPGGDFGIATDMHVETYHKWVDGERARSIKQDPKFARFCELMKNQAGELPLVYSRAQKVDRDEIASRVIRQIQLENGDEQFVQEPERGNAPTA